MIKSMTGYGFARFDTPGIKITAEIKTLNSKFQDILIKLPGCFSDREIWLKSTLGEKLQRGKINLTVTYSNKSLATDNTIDEHVLKQYYRQLKKISKETGETKVNCLRIAASMPDVISPAADKPTDKEWLQVKSVIANAIDKCDMHRTTEGENLLPVLVGNSKIIERKLSLIEKAETNRIENIKKRIRGNLVKYLGNDNVDQNRFEQEVIYFLEKLDITEEKVRLRSHLDYFKEVLDSGFSQGKKLGFITQEIAREINTIGSKANDATMQHVVVEMKEELEKIREQLLNIL